MTIVGLFTQMREHVIASSGLNFAESVIPWDKISHLREIQFDETGDKLKAIIESFYVDGIDGFESVKKEGTKITGIFTDIVSPALTKRFRFEVTPKDITYSPTNGDEVAAADFSLTEFAVKKGKAPAKKKNCQKGFACGNTCLALISKGGKPMQCRKTPDPGTKALIDALFGDKEESGIKRIEDTAPKSTTKNLTKKEWKKREAGKGLVPKEIISGGSSNVGIIFGTSLSEVGNDPAKVSTTLDKQFASNNSKNSKHALTSSIVIEKGLDSYEALDDGYSQQLNNAVKKAGKDYAMNVVVPDDPGQIELAKALQVPDKNQKTYFLDEKKLSISSDYGQLTTPDATDISSTKKGHNRSDEEVAKVAGQLKKAGGNNWVPVLVKQTDLNKYEVVGNHFAYDVAKKAGITKIRVLTVDSDTTSNEWGL